MDDALKRAGLIILASIACAYGTFLLIQSILFPPDMRWKDPIVVRDNVRAGEHHLSGIVFVPLACLELKVTSKKIDEDDYVLVFESWEEPSIACKKEPSPRVFDTVVFAPSVGVHFTATLDKVPLPIAVYPTISKQ